MRKLNTEELTLVYGGGSKCGGGSKGGGHSKSKAKHSKSKSTKTHSGSGGSHSGSCGSCGGRPHSRRAGRGASPGPIRC
jgi:hypothetical protein